MKLLQHGLVPTSLEEINGWATIGLPLRPDAAPFGLRVGLRQVAQITELSEIVPKGLHNSQPGWRSREGEVKSQGR